MAFLSCRTSPTCPTEPILAKRARHVIATPALLNARTAHWTEGYITCILLDPALELSTHCFLARHQLAMPLITALEANLSGALWALQLQFILVFSTNMSFTALLSAESDKGVTLERLSFLEPLILAEELI